MYYVHLYWILCFAFSYHFSCFFEMTLVQDLPSYSNHELLTGPAGRSGVSEVAQQVFDIVVRDEQASWRQCGPRGGRRALDRRRPTPGDVENPHQRRAERREPCFGRVRIASRFGSSAQVREVLSWLYYFIIINCHCYKIYCFKLQRMHIDHVTLLCQNYC